MMKDLLFIILIMFIITIVGCKNQYSKYGSKNIVELKDLATPVYNGDGQNFILNFVNNPYNIDNRIVIIRLDTLVIYRETFNMSTQRIRIPVFLLNKSCRPNLMIVEPSLKEEYYFENKDGLQLPASDSVLSIEFTKSKNYYGHIIFKTRK